METFAYLQLACANESSEAPTRISSSPSNRPSTGGYPTSTGDHGICRQVWSMAGRLTGSLTLVGLTGVGLASSAMALQQGDTGAAVTELQQQLTRAGCYDGPVTGVFGEQTREAVIRCQREKGLVMDGVAGPDTLAALGAAGRALGSAPTGGILRKTDQGDEVANVQQRLSRLGYYYGTVDGVFGSETESAVLAFQHDRGLAEDGVVGDEVLSALDNATPNKTSTYYPEPQSPPTWRSQANESQTSYSSQDQRYIVVVPKEDESTLVRVRQFLPEASLERSRLGLYVQGGRFQSLSAAESQTKLLRSQGLDARVHYQRGNSLDTSYPVGSQPAQPYYYR